MNSLINLCVSFTHLAAMINFVNAFLNLTIKGTEHKINSIQFQQIEKVIPHSFGI